jgi:AraC-like DNA-binding protein
MWVWQPAPDLAGAVATLWATEAQTVAFRERVLPRTTVELMINFGGRQTVHPTGGATPQHFRRSWVSGLQTTCLDIESPSAAQLIAASLHPAHAGPFLDIVGADIVNRVVPLDDLLARHASRLADRLEETPSIVGRFLLFEDFLRERLRRARRIAPAAARAVAAIIGAGGAVASTDLAHRLGCSRRYLEKHLATEVGLPPKQFARLVRFGHAVERIRTSDRVEWGGVAQSCGYYDQAHFNRDFRAFTGVTPSEFLATRDPSSQAMLVE